MLMEYEFSLAWFLGGLGLTIVGALIVIFYKVIANNLVNGVSSYEKVKLFGVLACLIGLVIMANLHIYLLNLLTEFLFERALDQ